MTVKDLRTLVDNLDEYIHVPGGIERLKKTILHLAVSGQLVPQNRSEGTGEELYQKIQAEKQKLIAKGEFKKQEHLAGITEHEKPFDIPGSWRWVRLGEITKKIGSGSTPRGGKAAYTLDGPIFLRSQNVWNDGLRVENVARMSRETYEKMSNTFVRTNDVLLNITGASIGRTAVVPNNLGEANVSQHVSIVRLILSEQSAMTHLIFMSSYFQKMIDDFQVGVSREGLSKSSMEKIPIPLSSIAEQARIVKKVKLIYQLIDELAEKYRSEQEERQKLVVSSMARLAKGQSSLELDKITEIIKTKADVAEFRKTILRLAISGQLVPQDPSEGTGQELYQQIQIEKQKSIIEGKLKKQKSLPQINGDEIPFGIPKSWKWARLADITVFSIGRTPSRRESLYWEEGSIPWVSIADLRAGLHIDTTKELISKKAFEKCFNGRIVPLGSLLYSFKLTIGKMSIIDMDSVHNEAIASFNTFSPVMTGYLFKALEVIDPTRRSNGAVMGKTLNSASLSLLEIPLPPLAEQTRIIQKTTQLLDLVSRLENYTER